MLLRLLGCLVAVSLLWVVVAPVYARGLAVVGRALPLVLAAAPDNTQYVVEGGRLLARRAVWLPQQQRMGWFYFPLWVPATHYGVPLLAALILATPVWRRRGRALAVGLGLLTLTQVAAVLVTIVAIQQGSIMNPDGILQVPGSPMRQFIFNTIYTLYIFFEGMGRGFFALLIYLGLVAFGWNAPALPTVPQGRPVGRNDPCPCGSGRKYKRCCLA